MCTTLDNVYCTPLYTESWNVICIFSFFYLCGMPFMQFYRLTRAKEKLSTACVYGRGICYGQSKSKSMFPHNKFMAQSVCSYFSLTFWKTDVIEFLLCSTICCPDLILLIKHMNWNVQSACRMTVGLGQDRIHASSVFAMPMIGSARTQWRTPTLNSEWLIKLTDPRDSENVNRVNIRLDSL